MKNSFRHTLNDICEFIVDCEHKTAPIQETGYPSIRTPNIGKGRLILDGVNRVSENTYKLWTQRAIPKAGDLILAREAPVGNVAIIPENLDVCLGQRTVLIRPNKEKVNNNYLVYLLLSDEIRGSLLSRSNGSTVGHLNMREIRNLEIPELPTLPIQQRIAKILSNYDRLIDNNTRRIALLEESIHRLYQEWFVYLRFPGCDRVAIVDGVPEGWEKKSLHRVATLNYGKALKKDDRKTGTVPVYGSSGIVGYHNQALVSAPGIIVGRKGNVGSVFWASTPFYPIDTVYYIDCNESSFFLYHTLSKLTFVNTDAAVPGLNRNYAYSIELLLPSPSLVQDFESFATPIHNQIECLRSHNRKLREARDLVLPRLMNGSLAV